MRYNPPPNWPAPPAGWSPPHGWQPDLSWGPAPQGWHLWIEDAPTPARRNWFLRHKIISGIGAIFLLGVVGSALGGGDATEPVVKAESARPSTTSTASSASSSRASTKSAANSTAAPIVKTTTTKAPQPSKSASFKAVTSRDFKKLFKSPDSHVGDRVILWAEVTQIDAATGNDHFLAMVGNSKQRPSYGYVDYSDSGMFDGDAHLFEDVVETDLLEIRATVVGSLSYDTQIGGNTTVPEFKVDAVKRYGHTGG